jgi:O-antigen ligase
MQRSFPMPPLWRPFAARRAAPPRISWAERGIVLLALVHAAGAVDTLQILALPGTAIGTPLWLALYLWALIALLAGHGMQWILWLLRFRPLLTAVVVAALASAVWSSDPDLTLQRAIHLVGSTLFGVYIGYRLPLPTALRLLGAAFALILFGDVVFVAVDPQRALQEYDGAMVWRGLHADKNGFAFAAAIGVLFFALRGIAADARWRPLSLALVPLALVCLGMANSATALGALLAGALLALLLALTTVARLHGAAVPALGITVLAAVAAVLSLVDAGELLALIGRSLDFTGRQEVWNAAWALTLRHPWLGTGYGTVWFPKPEAEILQMTLLGIQWPASHAHNVFLQISSELGLPIACAALAVLLRLGAEAILFYLGRPSPFLLLMAALHMAYLVNGLFEARLFVGRSLDWIVYVALSMAMLRSLRRPIGPGRPSLPAVQPT